MRILILGGTKFVGRHLVEAAVEQGHDITLFNRGKQNPGLFGQLQTLIGDRSSDLRALCEGHWDVVFDLSGYKPSEVRATAELLAPRVAKYIFVSSISAYDFASMNVEDNESAGETDSACFGIKYGISECAPIFQNIVDDGYGHLKAACERQVAEVFGSRGIVVRPGLIVGPYDSTFRFNYWLDRIYRGGYILAPGRPGRFVQIIDVRDLADFMLVLATAQQTAQADATQIYNATGQLHKMTMEHLLNSIADSLPPGAGPCRFVWASDKQLGDHSIEEWTELPLWLEEDGESKLFYQIDSGKAEAAGLIYRNLNRTVTDIFKLDPDFARAKDQSRVLPVMGESLEAAVLEEILSLTDNG